MKEEMQINGIEVFSATKAKEREQLGEQITTWLKSNSHITILDKLVTQSSDSEFHCVTITIFYNDNGKAVTKKEPHVFQDPHRPPPSRNGMGPAVTHRMGTSR